MKLYFNNDTVGINIDSYNHIYTLMDGHFENKYNITVNATESVESIVANYENVTITNFTLKNDMNETVKTADNLAFKIVLVDETINNDSTFIMITLNT